MVIIMYFNELVEQFQMFLKQRTDQPFRWQACHVPRSDHSTLYWKVILSSITMCNHYVQWKHNTCLLNCFQRHMSQHRARPGERLSLNRQKPWPQHLCLSRVLLGRRRHSSQCRHTSSRLSSSSQTQTITRIFFVVVVVSSNSQYKGVFNSFKFG